jgi:hypothetical protein
MNMLFHGPPKEINLSGQNIGLHHQPDADEHFTREALRNGFNKIEVLEYQVTGVQLNFTKTY